MGVPVRLRGYALIVEDDTALQGLLAQILEEEGCDVGVAATGADALRMARVRRPDAILLDYVLPDMSGAEFAREWRRRERSAGAAVGGRGAGGVPIILVTAVHQPERVAAALGANALVAKPFELDALLAALRPYLGCLTSN